MRPLGALLLCGVASLLLLALTAHAAVLGVDFGSEFIKVASVKPGTPFHIVVDEQAKRKVPAIVGFDHGERHFGNGAIQLAIKKPKETYIWAQRLLGKDINAPQVEELRQMGYPWDIISLPDRRSLGFRHAAGKDGEPDLIFSVEEVVAMSLQHVMKIAEVDAEGPVKDCVITVPSFWTHRERRAMLDAAELAGLNVLSLLNENTAAAIQYGIDRKPVEGETHTVMLYNMGSTSTQVDIAHYSAYVRKDRQAKGGNRTVAQFEMMGMGFDDTLGGMAFEARITEFIAKEVNTRLGNKVDVRTIPKAMAKVRAAAEKAKIILSANQETQVFLGSVYDDTDVKFMMTREQFYELCPDLLDRITPPMQQALDDSGLTMEQIDAIVIIGGSVRIPAVQAKLKQFAQKDTLAQNLNGDEAMVMGAVIRAANQSTTFKVRPLGMLDVTPYAVGVRITSGSKDATPEEIEEGEAVPYFSKRASLFKRNNRLNKKKVVQFTHDADFQCQLSHEQTKSHIHLPPGISYPIDLYNVTGLTRLVASDKYAALLAEQKPKVSLSFLLDASGLSLLTRAEATLEETIKVPVPKKEKKEEADGDDKEEKKEGEGATEEKKEDASAAEEKEGEAGEETAEPEFTLKKKTHTIPLTVTFAGSPGSVERMSPTHKLLAKAALEKLRRADDLKKEIAAAKNTLEAYIYATRAALREDDVEVVSTEEQRETAIGALAEAEDWLYEQADEGPQIFKDKLKELRALSEPIFFRLAEASALPTALNVTHSMIAFVRKQVSDYEANRPWVPKSEREKLASLVDELEEFVTEKSKAQAAVKATEPPVLESEQLYERMRPIHKLSESLAKLRKPIEKPKPKKKTKADKKNKTEGADAEAGEEVKEGEKKEQQGQQGEQEAEQKAEASGEEQQKQETQSEGEGDASNVSADEKEEATAGADKDDNGEPKDEL